MTKQQFIKLMDEAIDRLWDGSMAETQHFINEKGASGSGVISLLWKEAIKREKISEAVYKVEGQL